MSGPCRVRVVEFSFYDAREATRRPGPSVSADNILVLSVIWGGQMSANFSAVLWAMRRCIYVP